MLKLAVTFATLGLAAAVDLDLSTEEPPRDCPDSDLTPRQNSDQNVGYVMGFYGESTPFDFPRVHDDGTVKSMLWPFALDHCQALGPLSGLAKATFTCDSEDEFTFRKYAPSDLMCSGTPVEVSTYNSTDLSAPYSFNCADDRTEAYFEFWMAVGDSWCYGDKPTLVAVNVCFGAHFPPEMQDSAVATWFCDEEGADRNIFELSDEICGDEDLCIVSQLETDTCGVVYSTMWSTYYGKPIACHSQDVEVPETTEVPQTTERMTTPADSGAESRVVFVPWLFASVFYIVW